MVANKKNHSPKILRNLVGISRADHLQTRWRQGRPLDLHTNRQFPT